MLHLAQSHSMAFISGGTRFFGMKSEGNYCQLWIRDSSDLLYTGFGGFSTPFAMNTSYPPGYAPYMPSMIRIERT
eukprot:m.1296943 g.1296943  ORF g.1296943 m.1296943 type:complete len:75 (+) comp24795_c0_seq14:2574-2798(+)